jgi:glycosyltransferase involved in cell wall biosynthesis
MAAEFLLCCRKDLMGVPILSSNNCPEVCVTKKTVFLLTTHATRGGILNYMGIIEQRLEASGYDVQQVALYRGDNDDPLPNIIILNEARSLSGGLRYLITIAKFLVLCVRERPSVLLGCMPLVNILAGLVSAVSGAKSIATHHNPVESQTPELYSIDARLGAWGFYDVIVCVSDAVAQSFAHYPARYREHMCVIRNGIPAIAPLNTRKETRRQLGFDEHEILLLMAGRLSPQKNVVGAVSAMNETRDIKLILTGDGSDRPQLETIIRDGNLGDRVKLLGVVEKQQLVDLLYAADIFVQVSAYEGHSAALLEAIYAHLALLVSDVPTQVEAVTLPDGTVAAALCNPGDFSDIARAMQSLAGDEIARARLKAASAILAQSLRTEDNVLNDYVDLFDRLTKLRLRPEKLKNASLD